ncbi:MAG TPA: pirin family protein [Dokdonella sp.]|uniref:pirin family protein n=1 Tax=Dokdonella sp. TaxID=2291710 RepID=UPI002CF46205|nr:pirin family protein [Dokdonella sp.]HOX72249.1 pirin family protein [Dokdonella sp.]
MTDSPHVLIDAKLHDLGDGFVVRRMLPSMQRRTVGPFVFFDHIGPVELAPGHGVDVRPHPHIGLSTMTYLFDGVFTHRDSLGAVQDIRPGAVNWMTAGRGVVHSERTPEPERSEGHRVHGVQFWVGLPKDDAEIEPAFTHHPVEDLPEWTDEAGDAHCRLVAGEAFGHSSPVPVYSRLFCVDLNLRSGASFLIPDEHLERAIQVVGGEVEVDGHVLPMHGMLVLKGGVPVRVRASGQARLILFGGDPLDGPRFIKWNFVAATRERIDQASEDWREGRFDKVPGEIEFIPLPEH